MKIIEVHVTNISCKLKKPLKIAKMVREKSHSTIVKVLTDQDISGFGEATFAHFFAGETQNSASNVIEKFLTPVILGKNPFDLLPLLDSMNESIAGNPFAKAAVEMALWDIKGKALQVPVSNLLGGARRKEIPVCQSVSYGETKEMVKEATSHVEAGFKTLKIYCGRGTIEEDLLRISEIRRSLNSRIQIYIEANQRWTFKTVKAIIPRLEEIGILFIEQPIPAYQLRELRLLRESTKIGIALDESIFTPQDVAMAAMEGTADIANIYVLKAGGIYNAKKAIDVAETLGLQSFIGSFNELSISTMAGAHLSGIISDLHYPCYLVGPLLYEEDLLVNPIRIEEGMLFLNDQPGLGIEIDEKKLKKFSL
jgi:L-alanine-DL-glutamate epimerase-like enolase superfamily enzyme